MSTIDAIERKLLDKIESKCGGGMTVTRLLKKTMTAFDYDNDGNLRLVEFLKVAETAGSAISEEEARLLFYFWDTRGGQIEACDQVPIKLAVDSMLSNTPEYGVLVAGSAPAPVVNRGKGNLPSQEGGIFGGGVYQQDATMDIANQKTNRQAFRPVQLPALEDLQGQQRPKGNQSSVEGGIFGMEDSTRQGPPAQKSNRSNQPSIPGGIFGEAHAVPDPCPPKSGRNRNGSSIEGGIFG